MPAQRQHRPSDDYRLPPLPDIEASVYRDSFPDFVRAAWPYVVPDQPLSWNWHHDVLADMLTDVSNGTIKRLVINIPPGCSKSLFVSVFFNAWEWTRHPSLRYLTTSYSDVNTIRDNRSLRSIINSRWYQSRFPDVRLASDQAAKVRFDTTQKGWRIASSVGGMGTGEHPDRIIIDDPIKADDAWSPVVMENCRRWFDGTISTRANRDPAFILVMQRLHLEDLSAHLLDKGGWEHLNLPMSYEVDGEWDCLCHPSPDPRDRRTEDGELLWPDLWSQEKIRQLGLNQFDVSGQLQQRPVPQGGGLFKREWFEIVPPAAVPSAAAVCRGWDTAATEHGGDWTVGVKILEGDDGTYYVVDVVRGQWGPDGVHNTIRQTAAADGRECMVREEREGGSSGKSIIQFRAKSLKGYDYAESKIGGRDKIARAGAFRTQCEAGNVKLVRGEWNNAYLSVLCAFPAGVHDDDVDASSCAFNELVARSSSSRPKKATWRSGRR